MVRIQWVQLLCGCLLCCCLLLAGDARLFSADSEEEPVRSWVDSTGQYSIEGVFEGTANGKVRIRKTGDGKVIEVPFARLSSEDQRWLVDKVRQRPQPARAPAKPKTSAAAAPSWPGFRGPQRDGRSPDRGLLKEWPADGPPLLWKKENIGSGFSSAAVANGTVYITGDREGRLILSAFDLAGEPQWEADIDAAWTGSHPGSRSTATIDEDNLYLVSGNGHVGCYNAGTGKAKWATNMREFGGQVPEWGYSESVLIYKDLALITPGGRRCVVALNKNSGKPMWTTEGFQAGAQYSSNYLFNFRGLDMITNGTSEGLVGIEARTGRLLWSNPFSANNTANCPTPIFSDGYVFWANGYGKGGICLKLDGDSRNVSATEAWRTGDMDCHHGGYIIDRGYIYGNHNNEWVCLDLKTGQKLWEERGVGKGSLCEADGMLYLVGEKGGQVGLAAYSPEGMQLRGTFRVEGDGPSWAHPVVIGGRLYVRYDTNLYCFDVRT